MDPPIEVTITNINSYQIQSLLKMGFIAMGNENGRWKFGVPCQFNVVRTYTQYEIEETAIFYGDTILLEINGTTSAQEYSMLAWFSVENINAYHSGKLNKNPGTNYKRAVEIAEISASIHHSNPPRHNTINTHVDLCCDQPKAVAASGEKCVIF